jgi:hypothetical protein
VVQKGNLRSDRGSDGGGNQNWQRKPGMRKSTEGQNRSDLKNQQREKQAGHQHESRIHFSIELKQDSHETWRSSPSLPHLIIAIKI